VLLTTAAAGQGDLASDLCGGATTSAFAQPLVQSSGPGFTPALGTIQNVGQLPVLTARLDALGKALGVTIYGISGYRTPAHSIAVGGLFRLPAPCHWSRQRRRGARTRGAVDVVSTAALRPAVPS
jgi:hypothetical protein